MNRKLKIFYFVLGGICIAYYFVLWAASRLGLSMSAMWPALGAVLIACGMLCANPRVPRWLRLIWRVGACLAVACVLALEVPVISGMHADAPDGMDYLIVLGARVDPDGPSPALNRRLNCVMRVLDRHPDAAIIATGGQGPDEPMSEAECIRQQLVARGVDASRILLEDRSTSTTENLANALQLMDSPASTAGIITNNYHVWRAVRVARKQGFENAYGIAAVYTGFTKPHYMIREAIAIVADFLRGNI